MESTIPDIKFECSHCGQKMVVEGSAAGLATDCPQCHTNVLIPRRASLHDATEMPVRTKGHANGNGNGHSHRRVEDRHDSPSESPDSDLVALRKELAEAQVQISRLEGEAAQIDKLQKEKRRLRTELTQLKKDLTAKEAECAETAERAMAVASELNRIECELASEQEQTAQLRAEVDSYLADRQVIVPRLEVAEQEVTALQHALREREAELKEQGAKLTGTQAERTTALRELKALRGEHAELSTAHEGLQTTASETEAKLAAATEEVAATKRKLYDSDEAAKALSITLQEVERERDALSKSLSQDTAGKDLVAAREELSATIKDRDRLTAEVERLNHHLDAAVARQQKTESDLKTALRELDEARRRAEAASEERLRQDNEVLRGIIARQNTELEQRHAVIVRLKRAQFAVRFAYAAFGLGLLTIAVWAMKAVPALRLGKLF